ncbi:MAG: hypothetical protein K2X59_07830 [Sphingomonas sp.]|nr:hypothetical protein [Sphingomonas sp.]
MAAEIVHDDDVAGIECGREGLFDIGGEELAVDGAVTHRSSRSAARKVSVFH